MRVDYLHDGLSKVLLVKALDHGVSVMEFIATRSSKPRYSFVFHVLDLSQTPVVPVSTDIQVCMALEPRHLVLGMKRIPLGMTIHIVRRMYSALSSIWKLKCDTALPIFVNRMPTSNPLERVASTRPHIMIAANENERIYLANQPLY
tara:strand:+ start:594 stop:1034 length:441 start_codon:yes stop_codon:yes gene_type:complete